MVGNINGTDNDVLVPTNTALPAVLTQKFDYDDLYQLTCAKGAYNVGPQGFDASPGRKTNKYENEFVYDTIRPYGGNTPGYKFNGKELDPETGLYYFGARYFEPIYLALQAEVVSLTGLVK